MSNVGFIHTYVFIDMGKSFRKNLDKYSHTSELVYYYSQNGQDLQLNIL